VLVFRLYVRCMVPHVLDFRLDVPCMDPHVLVFDPTHAETVYRNEGSLPIRRVNVLHCNMFKQTFIPLLPESRKIS
jgi:hypothetical protein